MVEGIGSGSKRFRVLLLREIRNIGRFPYLELILFVLVFQTISKIGTFFVVTYDLEKSVLTSLASNKYFLCIGSQVFDIYLVITLFSSILSYSSVSYLRDIGFLKTEFSLPIGRGTLYLSKFLSSFLILLLLVFASVSFSGFVRGFGAIQFIPLTELILYSFMILTEAFSVTFLIASITTLLTFIVKRPGVSFIITFSLLYLLQLVSFQLRESLSLLPYSLGIFEERLVTSISRGAFNSSVFEPLFISFLLSLLFFSFGYYYVTRRMQIS